MAAQAAAFAAMFEAFFAGPAAGAGGPRVTGPWGGVLLQCWVTLVGRLNPTDADLLERSNNRKNMPARTEVRADQAQVVNNAVGASLKLKFDDDVKDPLALTVHGRDDGKVIGYVNNAQTVNTYFTQR